MSLNIKNERVHALAREAARRTGTSQTSAIEVALTRYLDDLGAPEREHERRSRVESLLLSIDERLTDADRASIRKDLADLYDDHGLPA